MHSLVLVFLHFPHGCNVEIQILSKAYVSNVQFFIDFTLCNVLWEFSALRVTYMYGEPAPIRRKRKKQKAESKSNLFFFFYKIYAFFKTVLIYFLIPNFFSLSFLSHFLILATDLPADCWTPRALFRYWGHLINSTRKSWDENLKWQKCCPACYSHLCGINCWVLILCM